MIRRAEQAASNMRCGKTDERDGTAIRGDHTGQQAAQRNEEHTGAQYVEPKCGRVFFPGQQCVQGFGLQPGCNAPQRSDR